MRPIRTRRGCSPTTCSASEAQAQLTKRGRIPTRPDTPSNPPEVNETLLKQKIVTAVLSAAEQKRWQARIPEAVPLEVSGGTTRA